MEYIDIVFEHGAALANPVVIVELDDWVKDAFPHVVFSRLSWQDRVRLVERWYDGGIAAFVKSCGPL